MASIHKRDRAYQVRWRNPDGSQHGHQVATHESARKLQRQAQAAEDEGRAWEPPSAAARGPSIVTLAREYIAHCRRKRLATGTIQNRELAIALFLEMLEVDPKGQKHTGPDVLSVRTMERYHDYLCFPPEEIPRRGCSADSATIRVRMLEAWWTWMADREEEGVIPRPRKLDLPAPLPPSETIAPTWAEMDSVIRAAKQMSGASPWYAQMFTVQRYTGLRFNQALRLKWTDIDMEAHTMRIRPDLGKSRQERTGRTVPISQHLLAEIRAWGPSPEGYVVHAAEGARRRRHLRHDTVIRFWKESGAREMLWKTRYEDGRKIDGQPTHAFRKGFETGLLELGANFLAVEYLIGHALPGTSGRYAAQRGLNLQETVDLIPAITGALIRFPQKDTTKELFPLGSQSEKKPMKEVG